MKKNKEIYSQPTSKLLVVRFEKLICVSYGEVGRAGGNAGLDDDDYDFGSF